MSVGTLWGTGVETPLLNLMIALTVLTGGSFGLAILAFTVAARSATFPLTLRSLRASTKLRELRPRLDELSARHPDRVGRSRAHAELMKEHGVHPMGAVTPQLVQMPLLIAMNRVVRLAVGSGADAKLSSRIYPVPGLQSAVPLHSRFVFMDLGQRGGVVLGGLVLTLMLLQAWGSMPEGSTSNGLPPWIGGLVMPAVFSSFVFAAPAGLGLYWAASVATAMALQEIFFYRGRRVRRLAAWAGTLAGRSPGTRMAANPPPNPAAQPAVDSRPAAPAVAPARPRRRSRKRRRRAK
jgi:YidC/Oxa1 family membrane protein insertase